MGEGHDLCYTYDYHLCLVKALFQSAIIHIAKLQSFFSCAIQATFVLWPSFC